MYLSKAPAKNISFTQRVQLASWRKITEAVGVALVEFDVTETLPYLEQLGKKNKVFVNLNHLLGKVVALGLREFPNLNSQVAHGRVYRKDCINLYYVVNVDDGANMAGTIIENADSKGIVQISKELLEGVHQYRRGENIEYQRIKKIYETLPLPLSKFFVRFVEWLYHSFRMRVPSFFRGRKDHFGSFMISNPLVRNPAITNFISPILPFSGVAWVLIVGPYQEKPVVREGTIVIRKILNISMSVDHRLIDGYWGVRFSEFMKARIEKPMLYFDFHGDELKVNANNQNAIGEVI